jgi:phosphoglycerol transferase
MRSSARLDTRWLDVICCSAAVAACLILQGALSIWPGGPLSVSGDHVFLLSPARQLMDGQGFWSSNLLGYPYGLKTAYWPEFEPLLKFALLLIAKLGFDVFTTVKIFYVVAIAAMAISGFICLRKLGVGPILSLIGAIAFTVSGYFQMRGVNHDFLSIYLAAAFGATLALLINFAETEAQFFQLIKSRFFVASLFIISTSGMYYAMFTLLFMGFSIIPFSFRVMNARPFAAFVGLAAIVIVVLLAGSLGPNISLLTSGAPKRGPWEQFRHGLSISDALYSFSWIPGLPKVIMRYDRERIDTLIGEGHHEWPGIVLSLIIISSPLVALWAFNNNTIDQGLRRIIPAAALITIGLVFASRGGTGYLFNTLINPALRGQSRLMPFLMFLAIFVAASIAHFALQGRSRWGRLLAYLALIGILSSSVSVAGILTDRLAWTSNDIKTQGMIRSFAEALKAKSSAGLTHVLQLPIASWPEYQMHHYGPIFDARGSNTKWSFGTSERQPGFADLKSKLSADEEPAKLVARARAIGFDGVFIEKRDTSEAVMSAVRLGLPAACLIYDDPERSLYDIGRAAECRN